MNIRYLYATDCGVCDGFKEEGIKRDLQRVVEPLPDIHWDPGPIAEINNTYLTRDESGQVTQKGGTYEGQMIHTIARDRQDDYEGLGTPLLQVTSVHTREPEEIWAGNLLGDTPSDISWMLENATWRCKRIITKTLFHTYLSFDLSLRKRDVTKLKNALTPEVTNGEYQLTEWQHAFIDASNLHY